MTPTTLYDIFRKKFKGIADDTFVTSFRQDRTNPQGLYLNTKIGKLYFYYDKRKDTWLLTNDVVLKNTALKDIQKTPKEAK